MSANRIAKILAQARESHQRRVDESREMAPTWRETAKALVMALALLLALALLMTLGSD